MEKNRIGICTYKIMADQLPWLSIITVLPIIAAFAVPFLPDKDGKKIRWYALGVVILPKSVTH